MKKRKKYISILPLLFLSILCYAQSDTVYIVKTDTVFVSENMDEMYRYFVESRGAATNHLWKLNLVDFGLFKPNIGYEHRLGKPWSVDAYLRVGIETSADMKFTLAGFRVAQQFRYYHNLKRRENLGRRTSGFSGNYFASTVFLDLYRSDYRAASNTSAILSSVLAINAGLIYGMQRRIGDLRYFDIYLGFAHRHEYNSITTRNSNYDMESWTEGTDQIIPVYGIKAGFAIDSFDRLRRKIKA